MGLADKVKKAVYNKAARTAVANRPAQETHVTTGELREGDILLVKLYDDYEHWKRVDGIAPYAHHIGNDAISIVAAQAVFSHLRGGSATAEHAMLVAADGAESVYESVGSGVTRTNGIKDRVHAVYRPANMHHAVVQEALHVAAQLARHVDVTVGSQNHGSLLTSAPAAGQVTKSSVGYRSVPGMSASLFRVKKPVVFRNARLERVRRIVYDSPDEAHLRNGLSMICTEFVATCYEVAALHLGVPPLLNVDPRAMSAKAFEAVLKRRSADFIEVGVYQGSDRIVHRCGTCAQEVGCMYMTAPEGGRFSFTRSDGKVVYPYATICKVCHTCPTCGDVWSAGAVPGTGQNGGIGIQFYCANCHPFPGSSASSTHTFTDPNVSHHGHFNANAGTREGAPQKSDDRWFVR